MAAAKGGAMEKLEQTLKSNSAQGINVTGKVVPQLLEQQQSPRANSTLIDSSGAARAREQDRLSSKQGPVKFKPGMEPTGTFASSGI